MTERIPEPNARLAALLTTWRVKPKRNLGWLQDVSDAFHAREPAGYLRYVRVSSLAVEIARLLSLPPLPQATIRASAFLAALGEATERSSSAQRKATGATHAWHDEIGRWRWMQHCHPILQSLRSTAASGHPPTWRGRQPPIESRVLAVAEDFDNLTADDSGAVRTPEALHQLRASSGQRLDPHLVETLWSEAGQAVCDHFLRRRAVLEEPAEAHLEESLRLLQKEKPAAPTPARHNAAAGDPHTREAPLANPKPRSEQSPAPQAERRPAARETHLEDEDDDAEARHESPPAPEAATTRSDDMTRATTKEEARTAPAHEHKTSEQLPLTAHLAAVVRDLEEIRSTADRSLEALASIVPALEQFLQLIPQLQRSLLQFEDGGSPQAAVENEPDQPRMLALRVERSQGSLDVDELANALDSIRDLTELQVQDHGPTWAVLRAQACPDVDLSLLEAKVTGSLTRHLGAPETSVEVTFLPAA